MTQDVGIGEKDLLSRGAGRLDEQSTGIKDRLQSLLNVLDQDGQALQGNALRAYREGQAELVAGVEALIKWCNTYGVKLDLGQQEIDKTDAASHEAFTKAQGELTHMKSIH